MIKEFTRIAMSENIYHTGFVNHKESQATTTCPLWMKHLFGEPSIEGVVTEGFRLMEARDVHGVTMLLNGYLTAFKFRSVFDEISVEHWFLPREDCVYSYVRESGEAVTDFGSFYVQKLKMDDETANVACLFYYACTKTSLENLIGYLVNVAQDLEFGGFTIVELMDLEKCNLTKQNFFTGDFSINHHLQNFGVAGVKPCDIGFIVKRFD